MGRLISDKYEAWKAECNARFVQLKKNEEELNRIFIEIYGLQDELTPDVADKDVTVHYVVDSKDDIPESLKGSNYVLTKRDNIVSLISYAVGCMFGRYSLDVEGLVYAGGDFNKKYCRWMSHLGDKADEYIDENGKLIGSGWAGSQMCEYDGVRLNGHWVKATFSPDTDNCIPITDERYFDDDIVGRFEEFVKVVYGSDTLKQNLDFVAEALGGKGNTSREVIRNYFLNDFYKDHCKTYKKRPIYWLFDSGRQNGFKALVYMHRWNADTIGNMRVEYLHRMQKIYDQNLSIVQDAIDNTTGRERTQHTKRKEKILKQIKECKDYDAKIAHLALSRIDIDLDDGVKVNYEKVQTAQDSKKIQILGKI